MPWIYPRTDQALWELGEELAALGGVRGQDYSPAPGQRWHYQVPNEDLYRRWRDSIDAPSAETASTDPAPQDKAPAAPEPPAESEAAAKNAPPTAEQATEPAQAATDGTAGTAAKPNQRTAKARESASRKG